MKRTYTLSELLWRKMFDYGYETIDDLAADAGINRSTLWHIMNEESRRPSAKIRRALCRTLDIDPDVLRRATTNGWTPGKKE